MQLSASNGGDMKPLRLAWTGSAPRPGGGAAGAGWLIMQGLVRLGCQIDLYGSGPHEEYVERFSKIDGVRLRDIDLGWRYGRWYSSHAATAFVSQLGDQAWARRKLASRLLVEHRREPYDVIYQFSTIEVFGLQRKLDELPPLVIHPQTHIAGELRWMRAERSLAASCEPLWRRALVEGMMTTRVARQRRDIKLASRVAAISRRFGSLLEHDYDVAADRLELVRNPVDLEEMSPQPRPNGGRPLRVAFVGRMAVRKGVELLVELSHRLDDLESQITFDLVGDHSLWSDYRPLLRGLNSRIARYHGPLSRERVTAFLSESDLLVQPAKYEPFGLTLAEALAMGVPVVASNEVGAAEDVATDCCRVVNSGAIVELEAAVRAMVARMQSGDAPRLRALARAEAERLFSADDAASAVHRALLEARRDPRG
jgi:glycosyltransferase involved in cell wall biosynthesis